MAEILIVEDESGINELIRRTLTMTGHHCLQAYTGREGVQLAQDNGCRIDLVLLDINLPDMDGFQVIKEMRDLPVIYVTARDQVPDRVRGLNSGAEDYIVKPFAMEELIARVQVVLRRFHKEEKLFYLKDLQVNLEEHVVYRRGKEVVLTNREFRLLQALIVNKNIALSRAQLLDLAWGRDYFGDDRTVDVHIQRIRRKLGLEQQIKTIFKYGYRLEV